jgi:hypothetical protein
MDMIFTGKKPIDNYILDLFLLWIDAWIEVMVILICEFLEVYVERWGKRKQMNKLGVSFWDSAMNSF